jgi:hypothetical protein
MQLLIISPEPVEDWPWTLLLNVSNCLLWHFAQIFVTWTPRGTPINPADLLMDLSWSSSAELPPWHAEHAIPFLKWTSALYISAGVLNFPSRIEWQLKHWSLLCISS